MTQAERKQLLLKMLEANDKMSEKSPYNILIYATCLQELSNSHEMNHAMAICRYEQERENAEYISDDYCRYILDLEQPDAHSYKLLRIMEAKEELVQSLYNASEEGYNYFLGIYKEDTSFPDIEP